MGRDRVGRGQRQLRPRDLEHRLLALGVQLPDLAGGVDRVETGLRRPIELPGCPVKLHVDAGRPQVVLLPDPGVDAAGAASEEELVLGDRGGRPRLRASRRPAAACRRGSRCPGRDTGATGPARPCRTPARAGKPPSRPELFLPLPPRLRLQNLGGRRVQGHRPAERRLGRAAVVLGAVLVDLVFGVVVGNNGCRPPELRFSQARVARPRNDPAPGLALCRGQPATFDGLAVEVAPVLLRQLAAPQLVHDLVPPVVLAALALLQLRHALQGAAPHQVSAVVRQEVRLGIGGRDAVEKARAWRGGRIRARRGRTRERRRARAWRGGRIRNGGLATR